MARQSAAQKSVPRSEAIAQPESCWRVTVSRRGKQGAWESLLVVAPNLEEATRAMLEHCAPYRLDLEVTAVYDSDDEDAIRLGLVTDRTLAKGGLFGARRRRRNSRREVVGGVTRAGLLVLLLALLLPAVATAAPADGWGEAVPDSYCTGLQNQGKEDPELKHRKDELKDLKCAPPQHPGFTCRKWMAAVGPDRSLMWLGTGWVAECKAPPPPPTKKPSADAGR